MNRQTRRRFIAGAAALGATGALAAATGEKPATSYPLVHHVFFWLKRPDSQEDLNKLVRGLKTLGEIESVKGIHIGVPASTEKREVVDNSFSISEILYFEDVAGQVAYQVDPIHQAFVEECSGLWERVVVYDAISV